MAARVFFDTNIFIYGFDSRFPVKQKRAEELLGNYEGVVSYQVVQEFLNVMTTKFEVPLSRKDLQVYLSAVLWPMCEVQPTAELYVTALSIREKTGWKFYDSLIVAGAMIADCTTLYTEDLQSGRIFEGLEIRNPFEDPTPPPSPRPSRTAGRYKRRGAR